MSVVKLPKQWRRWAKKAGLKDSYSSSLRRRYQSCYFTGHGRHWRIDCFGDLDMSCPIDEFDRWANSLERCTQMTAKTEREFVCMVGDALSSADAAIGRQMKESN